MDALAHTQNPLARAAAVLRSQDMPGDEIEALLATDDPELVHRYLELHLERLDELLTERRRILTRLEQLLAEGAAVRKRRGS